ncbi:tryptase beta-2 [Nephila pilipes]|uniref:Tryptase beta-2 n=1 Tax=Nephila pilipes TaxID=299642 RepID=A0A8X6QTS0_NEPPI|nr:tryptase beta-2 [Nephila pilipes]
MTGESALKSVQPECIGYSPAKECYISEKEVSIYLLGSERFGQKLEIKRFIPHDRYHHDLIINDIALIELAQPLNCLPTKEEMYKEDQTLFVAGCGWNKSWGFESATKLREEVMRQVSPHNCMIEELPKETVNQFQCAAGTTQVILADRLSSSSRTDSTLSESHRTYKQIKNSRLNAFLHHSQPSPKCFISQNGLKHK